MRDKWPYLFVGALFALFACNCLLTRGMFMDGLIYTSIAANMAEGAGSMWHPTYTLTQFVEFYEHPPLMMWLLSLWMRVFGTSMLAAKAYSVAVLLLTAVLMVAVWNRLMPSMSSAPDGVSQLNTKYLTLTSAAWLPLLLFTLIPDVPLAAHNNYLECTMTVFVLASVWCVLRSRGMGWHLLGGVMLALAAITKGPTGLFPLALPMLLCLFGERRGVGKAMAGTRMMTVGVVLPLALLCLAVPDAAQYLSRYWQHQVVGGSHVQLVSRTYILTRLFTRPATVLVPVAVVALLSIWRKGAAWCPTKEHWRRAGLLFALALCGTLPMMVSTKQRAFYLLTVFPLVALAAAAVLEPLARQASERIRGAWVTIATIVMCLAALALNLLHWQKPGRDQAMLHDIALMATQVERGETVAITPPLAHNYSLHGYWYFYHRVSLDVNQVHPHLIATTDAVDTSYHEVPLPTEQYRLYALSAK